MLFAHPEPEVLFRLMLASVFILPLLPKMLSLVVKALIAPLFSAANRFTRFCWRITHPVRQAFKIFVGAIIVEVVAQLVTNIIFPDEFDTQELVLLSNHHWQAVETFFSLLVR